MTQAAHIVVVDDEADVRETFGEYLTSRGYRVTMLDGGAALRSLTAVSVYDLVLVDLRMPGEDGLSLVRFLRERTNAGIVMVTAIADTADRILGLEMGADDYLAKPCDLRELLARVRSVLRQRAALAEQTPRVAVGERIRFGDLVLDIAARRLRRLDGAEIALTAMEYDLLQVMASRPGRVLSRDQLLDLAHSKEDEAFDRSIDIRVGRLRKKIEMDPASPRHLKTVRNVGYVFELG